MSIDFDKKGSDNGVDINNDKTDDNYNDDMCEIIEDEINKENYYELMFETIFSFQINLEKYCKNNALNYDKYISSKKLKNFLRKYQTL